MADFCIGKFCRGGASKASDKCSFAKVVEMERVDATGGASKARMP